VGIVIWIVVVILVLLGIVAGAGFLLPGKYRVERSVVISAPPVAIFPTINTLGQWPEWTAWTTQRYPDMKVSFSGPEAGVGARYEWEGKSVGHGELQITASSPDQGITYDLEFGHGKYISVGTIQMARDGNGTKVTWSNEGELDLNPISRYFGLLMDRFMGPDFETGLKNLKAKVESAKG
jgi:Polyketide cyclase / dehydrase and lipid transport